MHNNRHVASAIESIMLDYLELNFYYIIQYKMIVIAVQPIIGCINI